MGNKSDYLLFTLYESRGNQNQSQSQNQNQSQNGTDDEFEEANNYLDIYYNLFSHRPIPHYWKSM